MKIKSFVLALVVSGTAIAEPIPGQTLLSYFQANCRTNGEWTRMALADSQALAETLRALQSDPDCKSVGGAVANLDLLSHQLTNLANVSDTQSKIADLNAQEQELMVQLAQTTTAAVRDQIGQKLRDLQLSRASYLSQEKSQQQLTDKSKVQAMSDVIQIANTTFTQLAANQTCLNKSGILSTATSIMASVGATAAMVNPALGIGLTAGAGVLGSTVEGIRNYRNSYQIKKATELTTAYAGYKCALETLANRWCDMKDADAFINFKINERMKPVSNSDLGQAIRLNDREIPVLMNWLSVIKAGVTPGTLADSAKITTVLNRENRVRTGQAGGNGLINDSRAAFAAAKTRDERWAIVKAILSMMTPSSSITSNGNGDYTPDPFMEVLTKGYIPFFLLGLDDDTSIQIPGTQPGTYVGYYTLDTWSGRNTFDPNIDTIQRRFNLWVKKAQDKVDQEMTNTIRPDIEETLTSAYEKTGNQWKLSPMDALKNLISFLEANQPRSTEVAFSKIFKSTIQKLKDIREATENYVIQGNETIPRPDGTSETPIQVIYETAQLKYGTVVLNTRLDLIVRLAILEFLEHSSTEDQTLVAQLLAAERFTETLSKVSGTANLAAIKQDIENNAQPIAISNLNSFADVFGDNISRILKNLYNQELQNPGTVGENYRKQRTQMCFLLLAVPNILNYVNVSYCEGVKLDPIITNGPSAPALNLQFYQQDLKQRACVYQDYIRQNKIYENWDIKP